MQGIANPSLARANRFNSCTFRQNLGGLDICTEFCHDENMTKTLPITQARQDLPQLVQNASRLLDEYVITVNGSPAAVLLSAAQYDSWKETMEILADPQLVADIKAGEEDIKKGRVYDWEDVKRELGINVYNKSYRQSKKAAKRSLQTI